MLPENMRDIGENIPNFNGKIIRSNLPINLTENDFDYFKKIGIKHVIDLRTKEEYSNKISSFENREDFSVFHCEILGGNNIPTSVDKVPYSYLKMLETKEIRYIFDLIDKGENILFFCSAGKDRTGVIAILILMYFKVPYDIICSDYLKTLSYMDKLLQDHTFSDEIVDIITPKKEYIDKFMELFKAKYISIDNYLKILRED